MTDEQRSSRPPKPGALYDDPFPPRQRLPRTFRIRVEELNTDPRRIVLYQGRRQIGDELTDNSYDDDGYRFHDVFHLAYAALLGWSPVIRKLLGRKRRRDPRIDEVEDGGRATAIEEGIATLAFGHARKHAFFAGSDTVDPQLLANILDAVTTLEVASASASDWERAILAGFRVWRQVREHRGGLVSGDLNARTIVFQRLGASIFTADNDAREMGATHWSLVPTWDDGDLNLAVLLRREPRARCPECSKWRVMWQPINQEGGPNAACIGCQDEAGWTRPRPLPCPYPTHTTW
jgi:hypothetical protein